MELRDFLPTPPRATPSVSPTQPSKDSLFWFSKTEPRESDPSKIDGETEGDLT